MRRGQADTAYVAQVLGGHRMDRSVAWALPVVVFVSGASALTLQVSWYRLLGLYAGVDVASATTVVAAFLAGLGIGALWSGHVADRRGRIGSIGVIAVSEACVAVFAWLSPFVLISGYEALVTRLDSLPLAFSFQFLAIGVPSIALGFSTPLLGKALTTDVSDAGPIIGRLQFINTLGAAAGAMATGFYFLGHFGAAGSIRLAGMAQLLVSIWFWNWWRRERSGDQAQPSPAGPATATPPEPDTIDTGITTDTHAGSGDAFGVPWLAVMTITGAVSLGMEQVWFRLLDVIMGSNSYSFPYVLAVYLATWAIGNEVGSRTLRRRPRDPVRWFCGLQISAAVSAAVLLILLVLIVTLAGPDGAPAQWLRDDGYTNGFGDSSWGSLLVGVLLPPGGLIAIPVFLWGMSAPFAQTLVTTNLVTLGRRTGRLHAAIVVGNVVGTLLTGFVLIDLLGTGGAFRLLVATGMLASGGAWWLAHRRHTPQLRRLSARAGWIASLMAVLVVVAMPSTTRLWSALHSPRDGESLLVAEDRSCVSAGLVSGTSAMLSINGSTQNGYPFDDFHVLLGLLPTLVHPRAESTLAIGFGIGSTSSGMLATPTVSDTTTVELCGGNYDIVEELGADGRPLLNMLGTDKRHRQVTGDGRRFLLHETASYDVVSADTLRVQSAHSGALQSKEFYELVSDHLAPGGLVSMWLPTERALRTAAEVFPHMVAGRVASYGDSAFFIGSNEPITIDRDAMLRRLEAVPPDAVQQEQMRAIQDYVNDWTPACINNGRTTRIQDPELRNTDLLPRDELYLNNEFRPLVDGPGGLHNTCT